MFLKIAILVAIVSAVWFGFKYLERRDRIGQGQRRTGERSFTERLRKSVHGKTGKSANAGEVEETESCPTCRAFVSVEGISNCGKPNCPY